MWTEFGTNAAQTRKIWGKLTFYDIITQSWFSKLMGRGDDAVVQRVMDLESSAGDEVKYDLLYNMKSWGVDGDERLQGVGEEALSYAQNQVRTNHKRLGHRFARMSQQRTVHNLRSDGRRKLSERYAQILDILLVSYLSGTGGIASATDAAAVTAWATKSGNALQAPDAVHTLTAGAVMSTDVIDAAVKKAKTMEENGYPNIRMANFGGEKTFVLLLHPWSVYALRVASGATAWRMIVATARERAAQTPLFTGALGEWNGVVLYEWERIRRSAGPLTHNLFLGAQAATVAFGNAYDKIDQGRVGRDNFVSWWEDNGEDYGNQKGLAVGSIFGIKKCQFTDPDDGGATARDFGVIRVDTNEAS